METVWCDKLLLVVVGFQGCRPSQLKYGAAPEDSCLPTAVVGARFPALYNIRSCGGLVVLQLQAEMGSYSAPSAGWGVCLR